MAESYVPVPNLYPPALAAAPYWATFLASPEATPAAIPNVPNVAAPATPAESLPNALTGWASFRLLLNFSLIPVPKALAVSLNALLNPPIFLFSLSFSEIAVSSYPRPLKISAFSLSL